jgi:hypothetical protein
MGTKGLLCVLLAASLALQAQRTMTVPELIGFIKSSIQFRYDDRKVADYVHRIKLTNKLDDRTVEQLQGMGAGPKTVAALRELSEASSSLPSAPPPAPKPPPVVIPPPDSIEQARILAEVRDNVLNYTNRLPDYICTQVTRRYYDPTGTENWRLMDTIQENLTFFEHKENYKVVMVNGRMMTNVQHNQLGGAISSGEFGSILHEIFAPETRTEFDWDHWATLRGRRMYVFAYRVPQSRSHYSIEHGESHRRIIAGYHGLVYVDRETGMVMRWKLQCEDMPADFPIKDVSLDVNYDFTKIADQEFVLPLKTVISSREAKYMSRNEAEFHLYRKFGAETQVTFDTPEPIPDEKTKEEPPKPDTPAAKPPVKKNQ